jgi:hypothetical protein
MCASHIVFCPGNDTPEHISGYDKSSAVFGVEVTLVSGFMSGLAHHV